MKNESAITEQMLKYHRRPCGVYIGSDATASSSAAVGRYQIAEVLTKLDSLLSRQLHKIIEVRFTGNSLLLCLQKHDERFLMVS